MRRCSNCSHFDMNDSIHCYGTCEILDQDLHWTSECCCPEEEIKLVESLQAERDTKMEERFG